ncbi:MAG: bifunctional demethylmenaquinone methyltransferase/2-methoxy-6-polyprenyl-1,4-benzoquinol methylase UbiE [Bacteroidales bacterium]|jgi:demethylmenaquinone methyltransferase/2-methoxy-6-polyprenyl-1,4-benzoquinol methylase|nr:bifunctional demethylmenaquinone methyltransferase/2-methoxy-6-polyprenyl-1,4-benzoquinol methylase UbiE [Bacteroidales bacterium]
MSEPKSRKEQVRLMFDNIARKYDFLNHFLSAGIDKGWRKKVVKLIIQQQPTHILDVATGTADLAIALAQKSKSPITGIDISNGMLEIGREKLKKLKLDQQILLQQADSENIPFADQTFDAVMVAFGVRNFETLDKGIKEMFRVLKPGGMLAVLEFSKPRKFPVKQLYNFYFKYILPMLGRMISKDKAAYTYLPESVGQFPDGKLFLNRMESCGFVKNSEKRLTFGIATIYTGFKAD